MSDQNPKPSYPQCEKLASVEDENRNISEFLEWLDSKGIFLGHSVTYEGYSTPQFVPVSTSKEKLLAEFFGIDLNELEREKRAILDSIRSQQS